MKTLKKICTIVALFFSIFLLIGCSKKAPQKEMKSQPKAEMTKFVIYTNQGNFQNLNDYRKDVYYQYTLVDKHNYRLERRAMNNTSNFEIDLEDGTYKIKKEKIVFQPKQTLQKIFAYDFNQFQAGDKPIAVNVYQNGEFESSKNISRNFSYGKHELASVNTNSPLVKKSVTKKPENLANLIKIAKDQYQNVYGKIIGKTFSSPALNSDLQNRITFNNDHFIWQFVNGTPDNVNLGFLTGIIVFDGKDIQLNVSDKTYLYTSQAEFLKEKQYEQVSSFPMHLRLSFTNDEILVADPTSMNVQPMALDKPEAAVKIASMTSLKNQMRKKPELTPDQKLAARVSDYLSLLNNRKVVPKGWGYANYKGRRLYGSRKENAIIDTMETGFFVDGDRLYKVSFPLSDEDPFLVSEKEGEYYKDPIPTNGQEF